MRYSDLINTPLTNYEWVRRPGDSQIVGLRSRARRGKTGPRLWISSLRGASESGDGWVEEFVRILLRTHGRVFEPWDLLRGKDVFKDGDLLQSDLDRADNRHWAPNCATFSRAREIPIKGVKNPPRPLRSEEHPEGIPDEVSRLSSKARKRPSLDGQMADMAARDCEKADQEGKGFSLEHPGRSLALHLPSWKRLLQRRRVRTVFYHTCMFEGSRRKKFQVLITNREELVAMGRICSGVSLCDRTGEKHLKWRPTVTGGKVLQFTTGDEREYPGGFCQEYARIMSSCFQSGETFLEIFSGPNAPLSSAVANVMGLPLPGHKREVEKGIKNELQSLAQITLRPPATWMEEAFPKSNQLPMVEDSHHRRTAVEAGRQPSYGKRLQLIPDGLKDPIEHLKRALPLIHPFTGGAALKKIHQSALAEISPLPVEADRQRLSTLASWRALAVTREIRARQEQHEVHACQAAKLLGRKPRTALMEALQSRYGVEDTAVPFLCLTGMPIVGEALRSPFFYDFVIPSSMTVAELLSSARSRRVTTMARVAYMSKLGGPEMAQAIYDKTQKEVAGGTMSGPWTHDELVKRRGPHYNIIPSFGLAQGASDEKGIKYRRIDDHSAGMTNAAATRTQKIEMAMADYVVVLIKALDQQFGAGVHLSTEDLKSAYRQVPLPDAQIGLSITAVMNPKTGQVELFEIYGQPFGAGHAVPNFYRVAEWLCRLLVLGYNLAIDHFFDDYFLVERPECSAISSFCVSESFALLGFELDPEKAQTPAEVASILGVVFNCRALLNERKLHVESKPTRRLNFQLLVEKIL